LNGVKRWLDIQPRNLAWLHVAGIRVVTGHQTIIGPGGLRRLAARAAVTCERLDRRTARLPTGWPDEIAHPLPPATRSP
jgi:hypothetical protein